MAGTTRDVVDELLRRLGEGDPGRLAQLYADEVDWALDWPDHPVSAAVPWIRARPTRDAVREHFVALAEHNGPADPPTSVEAVLVDGEDAVVLGVLRNRVRATGEVYEARLALHLTVRDGLVVRHHVYEDSLSVALAAGVVTPSVPG